MLTFGPVPSRRLGRSLGINNIPPKSCTYSCVYCQVGATKNTEIVPRLFYTAEQIFKEVEKHLSLVQKKDEQIDYLTFVPDGEPGLDIQLSETIERLRPLGIPIAIISNASLIWREEIRDTFAQADWVSLKVDAIDETLWQQVNRPHPSLDHQSILEGMLTFAKDFSGILATESMFIRGLNEHVAAVDALADFLGTLKPDVTYLSIPTRPPAEKNIHAPDEATLNSIFQIINQQVNHVELITGYEGNAFASTGNIAEDLLAITSVHPMREEAVRALLAKSGNDWEQITQLVNQGQLIQTEYEGKIFYIRRI